MNGSKPKALKTAGEVIDAFGGTSALASLLAQNVNTVSNWRKNGLPSRMHLKIDREAAKRGIKIAPEVYEERAA